MSSICFDVGITVLTSEKYAATHLFERSRYSSPIAEMLMITESHAVNKKNGIFE